jgi:hypothetical protein
MAPHTKMALILNWTKKFTHNWPKFNTRITITKVALILYIISEFIIGHDNIPIKNWFSKRWCWKRSLSIIESLFLFNGQGVVYCFIDLFNWSLYYFFFCYMDCYTLYAQRSTLICLLLYLLFVNICWNNATWSSFFEK